MVVSEEESITLVRFFNGIVFYFSLIVVIKIFIGVFLFPRKIFKEGGEVCRYHKPLAYARHARGIYHPAVHDYSARALLGTRVQGSIPTV